MLSRGFPFEFAIGANATAPRRRVPVVAEVASPVDDGGWVGYGSDVAVLLLAEPIDDVKPIEVRRAPLADADVGRSFLAVGYGRDENNAKGVRKKAMLKLQAVHGAPLAKMFGDVDHFLDVARSRGETDTGANLASVFNRELLQDYEAYFADDAGRARVCGGDSGGPALEIGADGTLAVVAVVSGELRFSDALKCGVLGTAYATIGPAVGPILDQTAAPCAGIPAGGACGLTVRATCTATGAGDERVAVESCIDKGQLCQLGTGSEAACAEPK